VPADGAAWAARGRRGLGGSGTASGSNGSARNRRRRRELVTTKMLENAIAAAAITGLSSPARASGMPSTL